MTKITGIAASDGIGIAKAYKLDQPDLTFKTQNVNNPATEIKRLDNALNVSKDELNIIIENTKRSMGEDEAKVFEAHSEILSDPEFIGEIKKYIKDNKINAETGLSVITDKYVKVFQKMNDNKYMQERATDVQDVMKRVLSHLLGVKLPDLSLIDHDVVLVIHDLTPSDTAQLNKKYIKAIITDLGGRTSHSAIMSRTLEIPAIVGSGNATQIINGEQEVIVDGLTGNAIVNPSDIEVTKYEKKQADFLNERAEWQAVKSQPTLTKDGVHHIIAANIGNPQDIKAVIENGGEGIGLFRSEFLYMKTEDWPTEDQQFEAYKAAVKSVNDKPVVIRTMDIGGDKNLPYLKLPNEMNPFMGYRAIRISLDRQDVFRTQLRALLRASAFGNLWIMFPMIATLNELREAKKVYQEERDKMIQNGKKVGNIKVGMMMEIPAAAVLADKFAKEVDFMSIGTNDLIGYSMAADRTNEDVSYLYQPYNPSILRLIKNVIDACHSEGKIAAMCGEMAGDQIAVPLLIGMGLDEFSMSASSMLKTRSLFKKLDSKQMKKISNKALEMGTSEEVQKLVKNLLKNI